MLMVDLHVRRKVRAERGIFPLSFIHLFRVAEGLVQVLAESALGPAGRAALPVRGRKPEHSPIPDSSSLVRVTKPSSKVWKPARVFSWDLATRGHLTAWEIGSGRPRPTTALSQSSVPAERGGLQQNWPTMAGVFRAGTSLKTHYCRGKCPMLPALKLWVFSLLLRRLREEPTTWAGLLASSPAPDPSESALGLPPRCEASCWPREDADGGPGPHPASRTKLGCAVTDTETRVIGSLTVAGRCAALGASRLQPRHLSRAL